MKKTPRFTIGGFMILVAILAGLLALPSELQFVVAVWSLAAPALFGCSWLLMRGHRRGVAIAFWSLAVASNIIFTALCASPGPLSMALFLIWLLLVLPTLLGFGVTWAKLIPGQGEDRFPSRRSAWTFVVVLASLPGVTSLTEWPFRVRFLAARAALDQTADRIVAGQPVSFPQRVGSFQLVASKVDFETGGIALITDPNPNGPGGFVRHRGTLDGPSGCYRPIRGDWWHIGLGGGWCYHEED